MKKVFIYLILIVTVAFIASCKHSNNTKRTIITGQVANAQLYPETKEFTLTVKDITSDSTKYVGVIQKDGSFKISFDQYIAQDVSVTPVVRTFIAHPGDSIHIAIDFAHMDDVVFSGDADKINNDLYHYLGENYSMYDDQERNRNASQSFFKTNDLKSHIDLNNEIKETMLKKRGEFIDKYGPNNEVKTWTKNYIDINYYGSVLGFARALTQKNTTSVYDYTRIKGLDHISDDLDEIYNKSILNTGVYKLNYMLFPPVKVNDTLDISNKIINGKNNPLLKQMLLGTIFYQLLHSGDDEYYRKQKGFFDKQINEPFIKQPLAKYYTAVKRNFEYPEILSHTILTSVYKSPIKSLIDSVRKQNAGKVVLIDVWATWCAPCVHELPDSKILMEKYEGKDVKFVFICTGVNKVLWNDHIEQLKLGQHYYLDQEQTKELRKAFNINGIPYKMLLNKKGDIIEKGNGLRANDPLTGKKINRLLGS
jgi:thiol-disulfide isomerase/thioredoxin